MDLTRLQLTLALAVLTAVVTVGAALISRSGAKYSARVAAAQKKADNELDETQLLMAAFSRAAAAADFYVLNIAGIARDRSGEAGWEHRRPLLEPVLAAHGEAIARVYALPQGSVRDLVEQALTAIIDTTQSDVIAGKTVWRRATDGTPNMLKAAEVAMGERRRQLLSLDVATRRGRRTLRSLVR